MFVRFFYVVYISGSFLFIAGIILVYNYTTFGSCYKYSCTSLWAHTFFLLGKSLGTELLGQRADV